MKIMKLFSDWINILLYKKKPKQIALEKPSIGKAFKNLAIATLLVGLVTGLTQVILASTGMTTVTNALIVLVASIIFYPIAAIIRQIIVTGILHVIALVFRGKGSYKDFLAVSSLISAAIFGTVQLGISIIVLLSAFGGILIYDSTLLITGLISFVIGIWAWFLTIKVIAAIHKMSSLKAFAITLTTIIIIVIFSIILTIIFLPTFTIPR